MDRLSACYFCGAATVGDQGRVRVAGDASATVALCGDCTDKLDRLADAVGVPLSVGPGDPTPDDQATGDSGTDATAGATEVSDPTRTDPTSAADAVDDTPGIPDDAQILTDDDPLVDGREPGDAGGRTDGETGADSTDGRPLIPSDDEPETERSFKTSQAAGGRRETSHDPRQRSRSGDDSTATDEGGASTSEPDDAADRGRRGADDGAPTPADVDVATVPRETYNKVVRLLQNRTFPVERDTVVSVATSAYGLSRRNCDATIDALVEHGVLEESEDGTRLHRA